MENEYYVVRFPLPDGVFLPCDHGLDFFTSAYYVIIQSINQSINRSSEWSKPPWKILDQIFILGKAPFWTKIN